jgi:hypothetical protein
MPQKIDSAKPRVGQAFVLVRHAASRAQRPHIPLFCQLDIPLFCLFQHRQHRLLLRRRIP